MSSWIAMIAFAGVVHAQDKKDDKKPAEVKKDAPPAAGEKKPEAPKDGKTAASADADAMMASWMKAMTPGPEHEKLKAWAGSWAYTAKMRFSPDSPWQDTSGTCERKMIMGGRVVYEDVKGPPMGPGGPPFEGLGLTGYDNVTKKYWASWTDNMGTGVMNLSGTADTAGKVITMTGECASPMTGKPEKHKHVMTINDDKTHAVQMYGYGPDGKEYLSFEMTCTKK
jgi:hypothetical protein